MLGRRLLLFGILASALSAQGCSGCVVSTGTLLSWNNRTVEIKGGDTNGLHLGNDRLEFGLGKNRIIIRETEIVVNDETRKVGQFKRAVVEVKGDAVTITIDGKTVFP